MTGGRKGAFNPRLRERPFSADEEYAVVRGRIRLL